VTHAKYAFTFRSSKRTQATSVIEVRHHIPQIDTPELLTDGNLSLSLSLSLVLKKKREREKKWHAKEA
jgi:hypothetical protein